MSVIDTGQMVEIAVLEEWPSVHVVHEKVQTRKCKETVECKIYPRRMEKVAQFIKERGGRFGLRFSFHASLGVIEEPNDRSCVDERVYFEVYRESE